MKLKTLSPRGKQKSVLYLLFGCGKGVYYSAKNKITESDSKIEETREALWKNTSLVITRPGTELHRRPFEA